MIWAGAAAAKEPQATYKHSKVNLQDVRRSENTWVERKDVLQ